MVSGVWLALLGVSFVGGFVESFVSLLLVCWVFLNFVRFCLLIGVAILCAGLAWAGFFLLVLFLFGFVGFLFPLWVVLFLASSLQAAGLNVGGSAVYVDIWMVVCVMLVLATAMLNCFCGGLLFTWKHT